ncbi:tetratricopeptide repeat protein [Alcanivorax sp. S6407]|uniref:tetratricopeptide repeat protein n=1 Tax=Alcanivorax sp. S6407 TaxID=2926424 RepID=UPI001FF14A19|nr:tetratricopeptide repeat protein [Alcanivorax sp. S6407]MCK0155325.1 tetratricopeptide repeat protein [Alcanivorax sp. S6407]
MQMWMRLLVIGVLLSGCAVRGPDMPTEPMTAGVELDGSPALSLLHKAEAARQQGETSAAERYLERALNIAPDSSWLYKSLADLRLFEGDARSAEGFALKALRLAPDYPQYRAELWEMVATARERQGDKAGADDARARAADALAPGQPV